MVNAAMAQLVEHILGKDEVPGPNPGSSSIFTVRKDCEHEKPLFNKGFSCFLALFRLFFLRKFFCCKFAVF